MAIRLGLNQLMSSKHKGIVSFLLRSSSNVDSSKRQKFCFFAEKMTKKALARPFISGKSLHIVIPLIGDSEQFNVALAQVNQGDDRPAASRFDL